jgi:hypothetical protein
MDRVAKILPPGRKSPVLGGEEVPMVGRSGNTLLGYSSPLAVSLKPIFF